jgi:ubiquinone/menaquinone biosynthesis C-methylase UbiE
MTRPDVVSPDSEQLKDAVRDFWNAQSCGEVYAKGDDLRSQLEAQARTRYVLEPYIAAFAKFSEGRGRDVLEIGVGMGADHLEWAKSQPRSLTGIDLTPRAVGLTRARLDTYGFPGRVECADAEQLPFDDNAFDVVYSWGVLHHSPRTDRAISEVFRVLRPGGTARVMIYHRRSILGYMMWLRYGLLAGKGLDWVYARYLESPGTKAYSVAHAQEMFASYSSVKISTCLSFGDLIEGEVGQRHAGRLLGIVRRIWPRWFIRRYLTRFGMNMLIEAVK